MKIRYQTLSLFLGSLLLGASHQAGAYAIDGDLSDWLASAPSGRASDWTPLHPERVKWMVDDQTGPRGTYLDPGYGGQAYDQEAIYVDLLGDQLHLAIVTGRAPGASGYPQGDIALNLGWLGEGDSTFEYAVVVGDHDGFTQGQVVRADSWHYGLWTEPGKTGSALTGYKKAHPVAVSGGSLQGTARLAYREVTYGGAPLDSGLGQYGDAGRHYVIEALLDLDALGINLGSDPFLVHATPWCANDWIQTDPVFRAVPAPSALALILLGLLGFRMVKGNKRA